MSQPAYPTKEIREKCWSARDGLWKCLDDNNENAAKCSKFQDQLNTDCPPQWVRETLPSPGDR